MAIKPLRICIVTGDFPALTETFVTNKVLELIKRGHAVTVIKNNNTGINKSHEKMVKSSGVEILEFPSVSSPVDLIKSPVTMLKSFSSSRESFRSNLQLALLQKHDFDLVHFEFSGLAIVYKEAIKKLRGKTIVSCRGTAEKVKPLSDPKRKENLQQLFSLIDKIHCVSQDMAETIKGYGAQEDKIFINRPSIDAELFKRTGSYHLNDDKPVTILTIGRFTFQKGYLVGLLALNKLKEEGKNFIWKIVGDGPQREEILYHIHALGLSGYVDLCGSKNRDEILKLYESADMFLLPSVYEGIANVCLEGMSMELPLVATKSGGMEEVIKHGENGLLCQVYDSAGMANQIETLIQNFQLRKTLGENARKTVLNHFSLKRQIDVFEEEYDLLVKSKNS